MISRTPPVSPAAARAIELEAPRIETQSFGSKLWDIIQEIFTFGAAETRLFNDQLSPEFERALRGRGFNFAARQDAAGAALRAHYTELRAQHGYNASTKLYYEMFDELRRARPDIPEQQARYMALNLASGVGEHMDPQLPRPSRITREPTDPVSAPSCALAPSARSEADIAQVDFTALAQRIRQGTESLISGADVWLGIFTMGISGVATYARREGAVQRREVQDWVTAAAAMPEADRRIFAIAIDKLIETGVIQFAEDATGDASDARRDARAFIQATLCPAPSAAEAAAGNALAAQEAVAKELHTVSLEFRGGKNGEHLSSDALNELQRTVTALEAAMRRVPASMREAIRGQLAVQLRDVPAAARSLAPVAQLLRLSEPGT